MSPNPANEQITIVFVIVCNGPPFASAGTVTPLEGNFP
jgi:hypothetical protein